MKIIIFSDTYLPHTNGGAVSIKMQKDELEKLGNTVYVVTVSDGYKKFSYNSSSNVLRIPSILVNKTDFCLTSTHSLKTLKIVKEWNVDIIHIQSDYTVAMLGKNIAKKLDLPTVYTCHTIWEFFAREAVNGNKVIEEVYFQFYKKWVRLFCVGNKKRPTNAVIVPSTKTYNVLKERYNVKTDIFVVPNGIHLNNFEKKKEDDIKIQEIKDKYNIKRKDFIILYTGRVSPEKNIELLVKNHKEIIGKNKRIKLMIVGNGTDRPKLKLLAKMLKIQDNVIFVDKVSWSEIKNYYFLANIFVTASRVETQGLTVVEAMASATPVVCFKDEAYDLILKNNKNGYYFNNEQEYVDIILKASKDKKKLKEMGKNAYLSSKDFSSEIFGKKVLKVYKEVLNRK